MAISDGNPVDAAYTNSVLASKKVDNTLEGKQTLEREVVIDHQAAPDTPAASKVAIYPKSDNKIYRKDSDGVEKLVGANNLAELDDVDSTAPLDGQALVFNAGQWAPEDQSGGSGEGGINFIPNGRFEENVESWQTRFVPIRSSILGSAVDTGANTITIPDHGYATGLEVEYLATPGAVIGGLTEFQNYFVIAVDENTISLATIRANALAGTEINLTSVGGDTHQFRPQGYFEGGLVSDVVFEATLETTSPLVGEGSVLLEKKTNTSNTTANGLESYFFVTDPAPIDEAFRGRKLFVSGEYDASHANYSEDLKIYFHDLTNNQRINLNVLSGLSQDGMLLNAKTKFHGFIAPPSDCEEFSLAFVDQNGSDLWSIRLDNLTVTPEASVPGFISSEWKNYGPIDIRATTTNPTKGATTKDFFAGRRVGQFLKGRINYLQTTAGSNGSGTYRINIPSELGSINTDITGTGVTASVGEGYVSSTNDGTSAVNIPARLFVADSNSLGIVFLAVASNNLKDFRVIASDVSAAVNLGSAQELWDFEFEIPIEGWIDSASIGANEIGLKTLRVEGAGNGGQSITANVTDVPFISTSDPFNAWSGSVFTAPFDMDLFICGTIRINSAASINVDAYINGSRVKVIGGRASSSVIGFSGKVSIKANEQLSVRLRTSVTLSNSVTDHVLSIVAIPDLTLFASLAGNPNEFLSAASSLKTPAGNNQWLQMTGNLVTLTPGSWRITGMVNYSRDASPAYSAVISKWAAANGADSASEPANLTFGAGVDGAGRNAWQFAGTVADFDHNLSAIRMTVASNTDVFLVPFVTATTAANARVVTRIYAEKIA